MYAGPPPTAAPVTHPLVETAHSAHAETAKLMKLLVRTRDQRLCHEPRARVVSTHPFTATPPLAPPLP